MTGHKPFSDLVDGMSQASQERTQKKKLALQSEMPLHELRAALDLTQSSLAELLEMDQPSISRLERRADMLLSTLAKFVEAMGGTLEMRARFPDGDVQITGLGSLRRSAAVDEVSQEQNSAVA